MKTPSTTGRHAGSSRQRSTRGGCGGQVNARGHEGVNRDGRERSGCAARDSGDRLSLAAPLAREARPSERSGNTRRGLQLERGLGALAVRAVGGAAAKPRPTPASEQGNIMLLCLERRRMKTRRGSQNARARARGLLSS